MITAILLLAMAGIPLLLLIATRRRVRKDSSWIWYAAAAGVLMLGMVALKVLGMI